MDKQLKREAAEAILKEIARRAPHANDIGALSLLAAAYANVVHGGAPALLAGDGRRAPIRRAA